MARKKLVCQRCGKQKYYHLGAAITAAISASHHTGRGFRAYLGKCGTFHLTTTTKETYEQRASEHQGSEAA